MKILLSHNEIAILIPDGRYGIQQPLHAVMIFPEIRNRSVAVKFPVLLACSFLSMPFLLKGIHTCTRIAVSNDLECTNM
jgi:hypothetical protein